MFERIAQRTLPQKGEILEMQKKVSIAQQRRQGRYIIDGYSEFCHSSPVAS